MARGPIRILLEAAFNEEPYESRTKAFFRFLLAWAVVMGFLALVALVAFLLSESVGRL